MASEGDLHVINKEMAMLNPSAKLTLCFKVPLLSSFLQVKKFKSGRKCYVNTYSGKKKKSVLGSTIAFGGGEASYH